jgi:hypothetical protein
MGVRRYTSIKDNIITNAYQSNLTTRGTGSNSGLADSLEIFSIYAQVNSASNEQAKTLVQFPVLTSDNTTPNSLYTIQADRTNGKIPASGSVEFYLKLHNVEHDQTLPRDFTLRISPVSQSWEEGYGLDLDNYTDLTYDGTGSNWINASAHTKWKDITNTTLQGGSFLSHSNDGARGSHYNEFNYSQNFDVGNEDLEVKITGLVEKWIKGEYPNYGVGLFLTASQASGSRSYYTKRFSARDSEYFFKRPTIEARWDSSRKDHRGNFYVENNALSAADNKNTLYLYNYVRGQLKDINGVGTGKIFVTLHTSASSGMQLTPTQTTTAHVPVTGGHVETGIYSASFALDTTSSVVYDKWFSGNINPSSATHYSTSSFKPIDFVAGNTYYISEYVTTITNLQSEYSNDDITRVRLFTRLKDWRPTIYSVASNEIQNEFVEDAFYKVVREVDGSDVVLYGTGSDNHTLISYDISGSYFDLDMRMLEPNYSYSIKFLFYINGAYEEQPESFKFRVKE